DNFSFTSYFPSNTLVMIEKLLRFSFCPVFLFKKINHFFFIFWLVKFINVFIVFYCLYMFIYRYQCLSIACLIFGTVVYFYLSRGCLEFEHLYFTPSIRIMGWVIHDIFPMMQFFNTSMIGRF